MTACWIVLIAFFLGTYPAMLAMLGGKLIGVIGITLSPAIVWAIFTAVGDLVERIFVK